jgi:hypothetical protein
MSYSVHLSELELESLIERHDDDLEKFENATLYITNTKKWTWREMNNLLFEAEKERREAGQ